MTDSSIPEVQAFADALLPLERAALGLQDELSIGEIATATYPDKAAYPQRERLTDFLLQAVKAGRLAAYGNPEGWRCWQAKTDLPGSIPRFLQNPFPRCEGHEPHPRFGQNTRDGRMGNFAGGFKRVASWEGDNCLLTRADYLAFLALPDARGIPAPDWWQAPQGEPAPLPQGEPDKPEQGAAAKRQIALVEAEDAALAMLRKRLKREPDFEEFWNHITEQDDTGTIADSGNDRLMWTGKDGRNCETTKSTMRNRLTAAKKRNPFT